MIIDISTLISQAVKSKTRDLLLSIALGLKTKIDVLVRLTTVIMKGTLIVLK